MKNYDKTFCSYSNECINKECDRHLSKEEIEQMGTRPIWYCNYKETEQCEGYKEEINE